MSRAAGLITFNEVSYEHDPTKPILIGRVFLFVAALNLLSWGKTVQGRVRSLCSSPARSNLTKTNRQSG